MGNTYAVLRTRRTSTTKQTQTDPQEYAHSGRTCARLRFLLYYRFRTSFYTPNVVCMCWHPSYLLRWRVEHTQKHTHTHECTILAHMRFLDYRWFRHGWMTLSHSDVLFDRTRNVNAWAHLASAPRRQWSLSIQDPNRAVSTINQHIDMLRTHITHTHIHTQTYTYTTITVTQRHIYMKYRDNLIWRILQSYIHDENTGKNTHTKPRNKCIQPNTDTRTLRFLVTGCGNSARCSCTAATSQIRMRGKMDACAGYNGCVCGVLACGPAWFLILTWTNIQLQYASYKVYRHTHEHLHTNVKINYIYTYIHIK